MLERVDRVWLDPVKRETLDEFVNGLELRIDNRVVYAEVAQYINSSVKFLEPYRSPSHLWKAVANDKEFIGLSVDGSRM